MLSNDQIHAVLSSDRLLQKLAAAEHERWAHWQQYLHDHAERRADGALVLPAELVERWSRQIATTYRDLTSAEQLSDQEQVRRYLPIIVDELLPDRAGSSGRK